MKIIAFIKDHKVIDRIIDHLEMTFEAERPASATGSPQGAPDGS